jgi:N-acetylmuramoyl-L-alanine amidase
MKKTFTRLFSSSSRFSLFIFIFLTIHYSLFPNIIQTFTLDETLNTLSSISKDEVKFRWDPLFQDGVFSLGDHFGAFYTGAKEGETGYLLYNNNELYTVPLPYHDGNNLLFPEGFVAALKNAFTKSFEIDTSRINIAAIIIDPGHGGRDPGAIGRPVINGRTVQINEKDIVLKAALELKKLLVNTYPDKRILMTRENDTFLSLDERADLANSVPVKENEAVIFISIHANWGASPNARGYEVWHIKSGGRRTLLDPTRHNYSPDIMVILNAMLEEEYTTESIILADNILGSLGLEFGSSVPSRGRKANDWFVVRNSRMPAVLVELGFVSNRQDTLLMTSEEGLQKFTRALYNGIINFIGLFER